MTTEKKQEILKSLEEYKSYELNSFKRELEDLIFQKSSESEKAEMLKDDVRNWISRDFNKVDLSVLEKVAGENGIYENIVSREPSLEEFMQDSFYEFEESLINHLKNVCDDNIEDEQVKELSYKSIEELIQLLKEKFNLETDEEDLTDGIKESREYESYKERENQNNYPMWNYCFELSSEFETLTENALTFSGIGVISNLEDFNDILFFKSAGHSFYSSYWIPLYLMTFEFAAKKYAGVNYEHI